MNYVIVPFSADALIVGFSVLVALLIIILIAVLRRPAAKAQYARESAPEVHESAPAAPAYAGVDGAVVAAIAAAVAMMGQAEGKRLVVRAVRRSEAWADAGRRESQY
jgi:Na+-transporting methylmalonyl-CoA/oxaloacetate decarboxylase gamma subunit